MLSKSDLQRMRCAEFIGVFTRKTELLDHIDEQQTEIEALRGHADAMYEALKVYKKQFGGFIGRPKWRDAQDTVTAALAAYPEDT